MKKAQKKYIPTVENKFGLYHILSKKNYIGLTEREFRFLYELQVFSQTEQWLIWIYPGKEWKKLKDHQWKFDYRLPKVERDIPLPPEYPKVEETK
jgi:hypothetical protein